MFMTAIRIAGGHYIPHRPLGINREAYSIMRNHYAQFGLGVRTGIDLPNESVGFKGVDMSTDGLLLDLSIGQYDTYTPMQLAQYVSTIANGGKRLEPHMVKEIRNPSNEHNELGSVFKTMSPKVLNDLGGKDVWIQRSRKDSGRLHRSQAGRHINISAGNPTVRQQKRVLPKPFMMDREEINIVNQSRLSI